MAVEVHRLDTFAEPFDRIFVAQDRLFFDRLDDESDPLVLGKVQPSKRSWNTLAGDGVDRLRRIFILGQTAFTRQDLTGRVWGLPGTWPEARTGLLFVGSFCILSLVASKLGREDRGMMARQLFLFMSRVHLWFLALSLAGSSGCLVATPVAVFPAPEARSGMKLSFLDSRLEPIRERGLLLVHRTYFIPFGWTPVDMGTSTRLVEIVDGEARLPDQWNIASVWLMPNLFTYFLVPAPYVLPGENLTVISLITGYNYTTDVDFRAGQERSPAIDLCRFRDGKVLLSRSDNWPEKAIHYLESSTLPRLRRQGTSKGESDLPVLGLADPDYEKVTAFINAELDRLRAMQAQQSQPASRPQ